MADIHTLTPEVKLANGVMAVCKAPLGELSQPAIREAVLLLLKVDSYLTALNSLNGKMGKPDINFEQGA